MKNEHKAPIDHRKVYPITLLWGVLVSDRKIPVLLDHTVLVMEAFLLFAIYKAKEYLNHHSPTEQNKKAYESFINSLGYTLFAFAEYLRSINISWQEVNDNNIANFKQKQYKITKSKPNSRIPETARKTVNIKLRTIYEFYWWAEYHQYLIYNTIGYDRNLPIRSNIAKYKIDPTVFKKDKTAMKTVYPLCESVTAEAGCHRRQHYASDQEISDLRKHYRATCEFFVAERNVLIVDIIEMIGWRDGSVASLTTRLFSNDVIKKAQERCNSTVKVTPEQQKRGYSFPFDAVLQLVIRVYKFIRDNRQGMLSRIGKAEVDAEPDFDNSKLFISYTTGTGLTAQSISEIISSGFKSIGVVGERAGGHSIRRKFGKDKGSEYYETRKRLKLSTDPQDIVLDLAEALGQTNLASQNAYNASKRDIYNESIESQQRGRIAELESEADTLRLKVNQLMALMSGQ